MSNRVSDERRASTGKPTNHVCERTHARLPAGVERVAASRSAVVVPLEKRFDREYFESEQPGFADASSSQGLIVDGTLAAAVGVPSVQVGRSSGAAVAVGSPLDQRAIVERNSLVVASQFRQFGSEPPPSSRLGLFERVGDDRPHLVRGERIRVHEYRRRQQQRQQPRRGQGDVHLAESETDIGLESTVSGGPERTRRHAQVWRSFAAVDAGPPLVRWGRRTRLGRFCRDFALGRLEPAFAVVPDPDQCDHSDVVRQAQHDAALPVSSGAGIRSR